MTVPIVVLDACVLIPAVLRDTLLRAASAGLCRVHWSAEILDEVRRNLVADFGVSAADAESLVSELAQAFPEAMVENDPTLGPELPGHPKDRHVVAAAITSQAGIIVTSNLRHFPNAPLSRVGIAARSPDAFLGELFDRSPGPLRQILQELAASLASPALTLDQLLSLLAKSQAATLARRAREPAIG